MIKMVNLKINGQEVSVPEGTTILEAAREVGINIPTLCYLKDLNQIGACRMCLVEVKGARALQAASLILCALIRESLPIVIFNASGDLPSLSDKNCTKPLAIRLTASAVKVTGSPATPSVDTPRTSLPLWSFIKSFSFSMLNHLATIIKNFHA